MYSGTRCFLVSSLKGPKWLSVPQSMCFSLWWNLTPAQCLQTHTNRTDLLFLMSQGHETCDETATLVRIPCNLRTDGNSTRRVKGNQMWEGLSLEGMPSEKRYSMKLIFLSGKYCNHSPLPQGSVPPLPPWIPIFFLWSGGRPAQSLWNKTLGNGHEAQCKVLVSIFLEVGGTLDQTPPRRHRESWSSQPLPSEARATPWNRLES